MARILLAGESWSMTTIHTKGFDSFFTSTYAEGGGDFIAAVERGGVEVDFMPNHTAADRFPETAEELARYDAVVLSDIGANTLLLPDRVFSKGQRIPDRLAVLADWVRDGGALLMVGGYLSFQGIEAKANYRATALADVLPVIMEVGDDREETPQGVRPRVLSEHPATRGVPGELPFILGYQRFAARPATETLIAVNGHPLLVVGEAGKGRVAAFASDMGPHWLPAEFIASDAFDPLWQSLIGWLVRDGEAA